MSLKKARGSFREKFPDAANLISIKREQEAWGCSALTEHGPLRNHGQRPLYLDLQFLFASGIGPRDPVYHILSCSPTPPHPNVSVHIDAICSPKESCQALDLVTYHKKHFEVLNLSQTLGRMPCVDSKDKPWPKNTGLT